jgi:hypothetical protein
LMGQLSSLYLHISFDLIGPGFDLLNRIFHGFRCPVA